LPEPRVSQWAHLTLLDHVLDGQGVLSEDSDGQRGVAPEDEVALIDSESGQIADEVLSRRQIEGRPAPTDQPDAREGTTQGPRRFRRIDFGVTSYAGGSMRRPARLIRLSTATISTAGSTKLR
jgi:hypothetical protein